MRQIWIPAQFSRPTYMEDIETYDDAIDAIEIEMMANRAQMSQLVSRLQQLSEQKKQLLREREYLIYRNTGNRSGLSSKYEYGEADIFYMQLNSMAHVDREVLEHRRIQNALADALNRDFGPTLMQVETHMQLPHYTHIIAPSIFETLGILQDAGNRILRPATNRRASLFRKNDDVKKAIRDRNSRGLRETPIPRKLKKQRLVHPDDYVARMQDGLARELHEQTRRSADAVPIAEKAQSPNFPTAKIPDDVSALNRLNEIQKYILNSQHDFDSQPAGHDLEPEKQATLRKYLNELDKLPSFNEQSHPHAFRTRRNNVMSILDLLNLKPSQKDLSGEKPIETSPPREPKAPFTPSAIHTEEPARLLKRRSATVEDADDVDDDAVLVHNDSMYKSTVPLMTTTDADEEWVRDRLRESLAKMHSQ